MGTNFNYDDADHQLIYDNINGGVGSQSFQDVSRGWKKLAEDVGGAAKQYVEKTIRGIAASREGAAADAAAAGTGAMLPWMDDVASIALGASLRTQWQADHWVTAKNSVPPVPPAPESASFSGDPSEWFAQKMDWFPGLTTEEEKAQQRQQDAAEQARHAMRVYQSSSNGNLDSSLIFTAPQALDGSVGALPDPRGGGVGAGSGVAGGVPVGVGGQPAGAQPVGAAPVGTAAQFAPSSGGQVGLGGSGAPGSGGWTANPTPGQGVNPALFGTGGGASPRGDTGTRGGARLGSGRPGISGAPRYPAAGGGAGSGLRPGVGGSGFGPQPGSGGQSGADGSSGTRGTAPAGRGAGAGAGAGGLGAPFGGGGGQGGGEDREHRRKYLIQTDPHEIVGELPPTAPPVIGVDLDD